MCFSLKQYGAPHPISAIPDLELKHISMALRTLNAWTRRVFSSKNHIGAAICLIEHWAIIDEKLENVSGSWSSLLEDYEYIHATLVDHGNQLAGSLSLVSSHLQLAEGRRAFFEAKNISRLKILSLVFLPLGYVSSLFSMNESVAPGGDLFWLYFCVAIPVSLMVFFLAGMFVWFRQFLFKCIDSLAAIFIKRRKD